MFTEQEESWAFLCISAKPANSRGDIFSQKLYRGKRDEINFSKVRRPYKFDCVEMVLISDSQSVLEKVNVGR